MVRDDQGRLWLGYAFDRLRESGRKRRKRARGDAARGPECRQFAVPDTPKASAYGWAESWGVSLMIHDRPRHLHFAGLSARGRRCRESWPTVPENVWLNSARGVVRLNRRGDSGSACRRAPSYIRGKRSITWDGIEGAPAQLRPVPTAVADDDGWLWFATKRRCDENRSVPNSSEPDSTYRAVAVLQCGGPPPGRALANLRGSAGNRRSL